MTHVHDCSTEVKHKCECTVISIIVSITVRLGSSGARVALLIIVSFYSAGLLAVWMINES